VSKNDNLQPLHRILGKARLAEHKAVEMAQGQKTSRFITWAYSMKNKEPCLVMESDGLVS